MKNERNMTNTGMPLDVIVDDWGRYFLMNNGGK